MNGSYRIVIAEDNHADVMVVRMALEQVLPEFDLQVFTDGERILGFIDDLERRGIPCPDVMLLDLNMPKAGGLDVLQRLRKCTVSTPVIVITSSSRPKDREQALALGAAYYFLKPDDFDEFLKIGQVVTEVLHGRRDTASQAVRA